MKKNDLVSIIIPCYNQAQYLEEAAQSAIDQTYPDIEIIIINDGSADNTKEIALNLQTKYPKKIRVISQKNSGVSEARNKAIEQSRGRYILPLDADDLIDRKMIESCLETMIEYNTDIVYVAIKYFGVKNFVDAKKPFSQNNILYQNPCGITSLYKKEMWEKLGGYAKNMREGYEDWEFWINAYKQKFKFQLLSKPLFIYRTQEISRNTKAEAKDAYLKAKITLNHPELYPTHQVQKSISLIQETESLADLYFYSSKNLLPDKYLTDAIGCYLAANKLREEQFIDIPDTNKICGLYALDLLENHKRLEQLHKESEADFTLFYAPLRYEVPSLQNLDFAWDGNKGITKACGTIFPFVFKSKIEKCESQLVAHKRFTRYLNEKNNTLLAEIARQVQMCEKKDKLIKEKDKGNKDKIEIIKEKNRLIERQQKMIEEIDIKNKTILHSVQELITFPLSKKPIRKYKAYKSLLQTYFKLQKADV